MKHFNHFYLNNLVLHKIHGHHYYNNRWNILTTNKSGTNYVIPYGSTFCGKWWVLAYRITFTRNPISGYCQSIAVYCIAPNFHGQRFYDWSQLLWFIIINLWFWNWQAKSAVRKSLWQKFLWFLCCSLNK